MKRNLKAATELLIFAMAILVLNQCSSANAPATANSAKAEASATASAPKQATLKVGDTAPDFTLPDQHGKDISLSKFRGKENVVLAFYVLAFTGG